MKNAFIVLALVASLVTALSGCGGSDSTASTSGESTDAPASTADTTAEGGSTSGDRALTKAAFIKQADAYCRKADQAQEAGLQKAEKEGKKTSSKAAQEELVTEVGLPPLRDEVEAISELVPPKGDEAEVREIIKAIEDAIKESEEDPLLVTLGQGNPFEHVNQMAGEYGFKDCSEAL